MNAQVMNTQAVPAQVSTQLRLTRRGRIVFGGLATVLVAGALAVGAAFAAPSALASSEQNVQEFPYVVAQPGDSLWSIASSLDPNADARDVVAELVRLNQLVEPSLQVGDAIAVPMRFSGDALTESYADIAD